MTKVMSMDTLTAGEVMLVLQTVITDTSLNTQKIEALVKMLVNLNKRILVLENAVKVSQ